MTHKFTQIVKLISSVKVTFQESELRICELNFRRKIITLIIAEVL